MKEGDTISATFLEFTGKPEGDPALVILNVAEYEEVDNMVTWIRDKNGDVALVFGTSSFQMQNLSATLEVQMKSEFGPKIVDVYRDKITDENILKDDQSALTYWNKKFVLPPFDIGNSIELYVRCVGTMPCSWEAYLASSPKPKTGYSAGTSAPSVDGDLRIPPDRPDLIEQYGNKS